MIKELFGIYFAAWHFVYLLPIVIVGIFIRIMHERNRTYAIHQFAGLRRKQLVSNFSFGKQFFKTFFLLLSLATLFIALLRPCWGKIEQTVSQEGRDVLIAFDVSRSMLAQDLKPNRMSFAKNKVHQLLKLLKSDRVGLLIFAGSALVQCPLTTDYGAFRMFLDTLDAQTISSGTTALDQALRKAVQLFASTESKKTKLVILLTDGEDFSSNLTGIKEKAIQEGLTIFTVGFGTPEGAPIPILDERGNQQGYEKDSNGTVIMSRMNEGILRALAHESGGTYLRATKNDDDVREIVKRVEQHEREKIEDKTIIHWQERFMYSAALALLFLLCEWLL